MTKDELFRDVDEHLADETRRSEKLQEADETWRTRLEGLVVGASPMLEEYRRGLEQRGIEVTVRTASGQNPHIVFRLSYRDGGVQELALYDNAAELKHTFTNDDGKRYSTTRPVPRVLNVEWLETAVQDLVRDFLFYSSRHGGATTNAV